MLGRDGVARAKLWLEKTGRANVLFSRYDVNETKFLSFQKPGGTSYSFDMGGVLNLDDGNVQFFAEVKHVTSEAGQGREYRDYLCKCYRASKDGKPYHFMWITWHPFSQTSWSKLCDAEEIERALVDRKQEFCGDDDIDLALCRSIAERLWLVVLSKRQESLSMSDEMLGEVRRAIALRVAP